MLQHIDGQFNGFETLWFGYYLLFFKTVLLIQTDFGICFWPDLKGTVQTPPHYVGGKDIYVTSEEQTLTYSFDLR